MRPRTLTVVHTIVGAALAWELVRTLHQSWVRAAVADETMLVGVAIVLPIVSALASITAIVLGARLGNRHRALVGDLATLAGPYLLALVLSASPGQGASLPVAILLVPCIAFRLWAPIDLIVRHRRPSVGPRIAAAVGPRDRRRDLVLFFTLNAVGVAVLAFAPLVSSSEHATDDLAVANSLVTVWFPYAVTLATLLTGAFALHAPEPHRLYLRHAVLWVTAPISILLIQFGDFVEPVVFGLPYVLLVAGIAIHGLTELLRTQAIRSDRAVGLLLGATVVAAALALLPYDRTIQLGRSDEPHYLIAMQSLVRDRDLDLTNDYDGPYPEFYAGRLPDRHVIQVGNAQRPIHDLGLVALGTIPFAIGGRTGVLVLMCLIAGAFGWRGFHLLRKLSFGRPIALLAAGAVALLHPIFTYSTQIYPDLPAALAVLIAAEALAGPPTVRRLGTASAMCGVLVWLTVRAWFAVGGLGLVLAVVALRSRRPSLIAAGSLPFIALVLGNAWVDKALFDIFLPNVGYFVIREQQTVLAFTPQLGLPGLFVDRAFGLLSRAPLYALAFYGAVPLWRRGRQLGSAAIAALALAALFEILYVGDVAYWWSDGSPAPRYFVAVMALPLCALAAGLERLRNEWGRLLVLAAAAWTIAVTFVFALIPSLRYDIALLTITGAPGELWTRMTFVLRANPGLLFPSMVRAAPQDAALAVAWVLLLAALVFAGAQRPQPEQTRIL